MIFSISFINKEKFWCTFTVLPTSNKKESYIYNQMLNGLFCTLTEHF